MYNILQLITDAVKIYLSLTMFTKKMRSFILQVKILSEF